MDSNLWFLAVLLLAFTYYLAICLLFFPSCFDCKNVKFGYLTITFFLLPAKFLTHLLSLICSFTFSLAYIDSTLTQESGQLFYIICYTYFHENNDFFKFLIKFLSLSPIYTEPPQNRDFFTLCFYNTVFSEWVMST